MTDSETRDAAEEIIHKLETTDWGHFKRDIARIFFKYGADWMRERIFKLLREHQRKINGRWISGEEFADWLETKLKE